MRTFSAAALFALAALRPAGAAAPPKEALPFIENDYARALSEARSKKLPIFADAWAPW
jgi:endonuclease YncB( thermonuclease family)